MRTFFLILFSVTFCNLLGAVEFILEDGDVVRHFDINDPETVSITAGSATDMVTQWHICTTSLVCSVSPAHSSETIDNLDGTGSISIIFLGNTATFVIDAATPAGTYQFRLMATRANSGDSGVSTYTFTIRDPLRLVFVLDRSGSMECGPGNPPGTAWDGCITETPDKWEMAEDAMIMFGSQMNSMNASFIAEDRMGIIYFDGAIGTSIISTAATGFRDRSFFNANIGTDISSQLAGGILGRNGTGIGLGLDRAVHGSNFFNGDITQPHRQVIVLLTDGEQNRSPMVVSTGGNAGKELDNGTGLLNDQTAPDYIQVYTMYFDALGVGSSSQLLEDISTDPTQNFFNVYLSGTTTTYSPLFDEIFTRIFNQSTPQMIDRGEKTYFGDTLSHSFTVNEGGTHLYFKVSFDKDRASNFDYFLTHDGQVYDDSVDVLVTNYSAMATVDVMADTTLDSRGQWILHCVRKPPAPAQPFGPPGTISGRVTDIDNEPLIGAAILVEGTSFGTTTDLDGNYQIALAPGIYTLKASAGGFQVGIKSGIVLPVDSMARADFMLARTAPVNRHAIFSATINEHSLKAEYSIDRDPTVEQYGGVQVESRLRPRVKLRLDGQPITNAIVTAQLLKPGDDKGDLIARAEVEPVSLDTSEVTNIFTAKYIAVSAADPGYLAGLALDENTILLDHKGNGEYEGRFGRLDVTDNCAVIFRIAAEDADLGSIRRFERLSGAVRFGELQHDLVGQSHSVSIDGQTFYHTLTYTPAYRVGKKVRLVGPGWEREFAVEGAELLSVADNTDGSYVLKIRTPELHTKPKLTLLDEPFYRGRSLTQFAKPYSPYPWNVSFHMGYTQPFGSLASTNSGSFLVEGDLGYQVFPKVALEIIGGYYGFQPSFYIAGGGLHLRYTLRQFGPGNLTRVTAAIGAGLYQPKSASLTFGYGGRLAYERSLSQRFRLSAEVGLYTLPDPNLTFGLAGLALKYGF